MTNRAKLAFLRPSETDRAWRDLATCRFADVEMFFPIGDSDEAEEAVTAAKAMCRTCPVRIACLEFALETRQVDGIWGGTTEDERRRLRRGWVAGRRLRAG